MMTQTAGSPQVAGVHESLWMATTPTTSYPRLPGDLQVDVVVIGAGIAGLTTATLLKQAGKTVAVLEADHVVRGVTANTTAKITSLHTLIYAHLMDKEGEDSARVYAAANQAAIELVDRMVQELDINCEFTRTPAYTYTESIDERETIQDEVEAARRAGLPAHFVTETPLPFEVAGAVRFDNQASFHPRKYLLALAERIPGNGSHLFEQTKVNTIEEEEACTVVTEQGTVSATDVVLATHFPHVDNAFYFARMAPYFSYLMAMTLDEPVPEGMFISADSMHTLRRHVSDGQELLLVGGEGHKTGQGGDTVARFQRIEEWARERFAVNSVLYNWATQDYQTPDSIPYIGLSTPSSHHVYVATGFKGWGMSSGTAAGMILTDLIIGRKNPWADVFDPNRVDLSGMGTLASENMNVAKEYGLGLIRSGEDNSPVAPGEGCITDGPNGREAQARSADGVLHRLSPFCTHMGCLVSWNTAETTWDCPCHGSRFTAEGEVLHGPAHMPLPKIEE